MDVWNWEELNEPSILTRRAGTGRQICSGIEHFENVIHKLRNQACFAFNVLLFELQTPANDGTFLGGFNRRAEMSVRVKKGDFMVGAT